MIFNRRRFHEWRRVVALEATRINWWRLALDMIRVTILGLFDRKRTRARWFRRMRTCQRCFVYDPELKRCRPHSQSRLGCGCYSPFKALFERGACWGRAEDVAPGWE